MSGPLPPAEGPGPGPSSDGPQARPWEAPIGGAADPDAPAEQAPPGDAAPETPRPADPDAETTERSGAAPTFPVERDGVETRDHGHAERPAPQEETFHGERPDGDGSTTWSPGAGAIEDALSGLDQADRSATVICVANQKGGVGKTTTTVSLGAALAMEGAQVLVVDLDPQGNATTGLGLRAQEGAPSTYRVIVEQMDVEDAAEPTAVRGLHVLPSSLDLAGAEIELVPAFSRENRLKQALDAVRDLYDVILIDCPPSLGLLTINALVAADQVLVPIQCEYYALEGLGQLMRTVKLVADSLNRDLAVGGVVLTMFDGRTNLSQQVADEVRGYFGDIAYQTIVPRTVRLSEAPSYGQPIGVFDAASRGARAYQRLAREVARRLDLDLETEEVSPLDRLLGPAPTTTPPEEGAPLPTDLAPEQAAPLPTDLAPEDVPTPAEVGHAPAQDAHEDDPGHAQHEHHDEPGEPHGGHGEHRDHGEPQHGHEEPQHGHEEPQHGHEEPEHGHEGHHGGAGHGHDEHRQDDDQPVPGTEGQP